MSDVGGIHPDELCPGLMGGCADCVRAYLVATGLDPSDPAGVVPLCMACDCRHWPWEGHGVLDAAGVAAAADAGDPVCGRCRCVVGRRDDDCPDPCGCHGEAPPR